MADAASKGRMARGERHWKSKVSQEEVIEIRALFSEGKLLQREIGLRFGIDQTHVSRIIRKKNWKHI